MLKGRRWRGTAASIRHLSVRKEQNALLPNTYALECGVHPLDALDGPLYYLDGSEPAESVIDPALLTLPGQKTALVFSHEAYAQVHLASLRGGVTVQQASDLRAKEELLRAALARGADTLWLDTPAVGPAQATYPLRRALEYILSFKRQSACL